MCIICEKKFIKDVISIDCYYCDKVTKIPSFYKNITRLACYNSGITKLPIICTNLIHLGCHNCISISFIPRYNNLEYLNCSRTSITIIPILPNLKKLYCNLCTNLTKISSCVNIIFIECTECTNLTEIFNVHDHNINYKLEELLCTGCIALTNLPKLSNLVELYCANSGIKKIGHAFYKLKKLHCGNCINLESISNTLYNLLDLYCSRCIKLTELPNIPSIIYINFSHCENINKLPNLPNLKSLICEYCPNITEIPDIFSNLDFISCIGCVNLIKTPLRYIETRYFDSPWIKLRNKFQDNEQYDNNIKKLKVLQHWFRKNFKYLVFKRWIKSEEGVKWIYDPDRIGGKVSKLLIMRSINK